jgi:hypothetical protein
LFSLLWTTVTVELTAASHGRVDHADMANVSDARAAAAADAREYFVIRCGLAVGDAAAFAPDGRGQHR